MVTNHRRITPKRARYRRPKTPAPKNGWLLSELAQLTGLPESTLRYYRQLHLIQPIQIRGTATRYDRLSLLRLVALMRLKTEDDATTLPERKSKLEGMTSADLEQWLRQFPVPPGAAAALGFESAPAPSGIAVAAEPQALNFVSRWAAMDEEAGFCSPGRAPVELWQRIAVLPGLDLMLDSSATQSARVAAQRIRDEYAPAVTHRTRSNGAR